MEISNRISVPDHEIICEAVKASGPGGQNVNKVSSAIHLRFDIPGSSLPDWVKEKLMALNDSRITKDGILVIKARRFRTQEKNREDAINRLEQLIRGTLIPEKTRKPTKPSKAARKKRLDTKTRHGMKKKLRGKVNSND